jgi:hypothetical protein
MLAMLRLRDSRLRPLGQHNQRLTRSGDMGDVVSEGLWRFER